MAGLGVGGAAAGGLESGFNMGLRADEAQERRKQREVDNTRTATLDAERLAERDRTNARQDEETGLQALNAGLEDQRYTLGALQARYPGAVPPEAEARPIIDRIAKIHGDRQVILDKRAKAVIDKGRQDASDFNSLAAIGKADVQALPPTKFNDHFLASTGFKPQQFLSGEVGQAVTDAHAGLETQNWPLVVKAANVLLPEIKQGIGQVAADGSIIVDKELVGFAPAPATAADQPPPNPIKGLAASLNAMTAPDSPAAGGAGNEQPAGNAGVPASQPQGDPGLPGAPGAAPAPLQPGSDPDKLIPVLKVTTRQPDGSLTSYPTQITVDRSSNPNAAVAPPVSMKALMDRLGQIGVLNEWTQKPEVRAKMEEGVKAQGGKPTTYEEAWGMVHGDVKALQEAHDPTSQKINAIKKLAVDKGITFEEAARQLAAKPVPQATGVAGTLAAIKTSGLSEPEKAKAERVALKVEAAPKAGKGGNGVSAALGGATAPAPDPKSQEAVDFWAKAVIAGDKDWQVGLSRSKSGSALIEAVKRRVPGMAAELGLTPQDIGTTRAQSAALSSTLKDLTKRSEAVDLFASKVEKDMQTFDNLLDKASTGSPLLISEPINALRRRFSDDDLAKLDLAAKQVGAEYERLITGGTLSIAQLHAGASEDAKKLINGDMPPKQARAVMQVMRQEMANAKSAAHESTARVQNQLRGLGNGPLGGVPPPSAAPPPKGVGAATGGQPAAKFNEGQVYQDAKGNKAKYVGGNWVPV